MSDQTPDSSYEANPLGDAILAAAAAAAGINLPGTPVSKFKRLFWRILVLAVGIGLIMRLQIGFVFVLLALLPSLATLMIDNGPNKYLFRAVLLCNLAGVIPFVAGALVPNAGAAAMELDMMKPITWFVVYGAAAGGWGIVWACRLVSYGTLSVTYTARKQFLEGTQKALLEEWGTQVQPRGE